MKGQVNTDPDRFRSLYKVSSARAEWWDYSRHGSYYITISTKDNIQFFGEIKAGGLQLSVEGLILERICELLSTQFSYAYFEEMVIMPNHFHAILVIKNKPAISQPEQTKQGGFSGIKNPMLNENLATVIRWFKGRTSFEIHKINPNFAWHSRYYDHIIKNNIEYKNIQKYINENVEKWISSHASK